MAIPAHTLKVILVEQLPTFINRFDVMNKYSHLAA